MDLRDDVLAVVEKIKQRGEASTLQEKREAFAYLTSFDQLVKLDSEADSEPDSKLEFHDEEFSARDGQKLRARVYNSRFAAKRVTFFFHGGGYVSGSLYTHHVALLNLASGVEACFIHVDYRLAPEHKFPTALHDGIDAARHYLEKYKPEASFVCGDSAGGNLAAGVAREIRGEITAQILLYPTLDATFSADSWHSVEEQTIANPKLSGDLNRLYARTEKDFQDPLFSPLKFQRFAGLPPCFVFAGSFDPAKGDGQKYVELILRDGGQAKYVEIDSMIHGFLTMSGAFIESRRLIEKICALIEKV